MQRLRGEEVGLGRTQPRKHPIWALTWALAAHRRAKVGVSQTWQQTRASPPTATQTQIRPTALWFSQEPNGIYSQHNHGAMQ